MNNIFDYIKQYCESHGVGRWEAKSRVLTKDDFAKSHSFAPGIAFFYRLSACGQIENVNNIGLSFLECTTPTEFFDFSKIAELHDCGTIQKATSDFIFVSDNMLFLNLHEGDGALFSSIANIQLYYMYVTELQGGRQRQQIEIDVNQQYKEQ